MTYEPWRHSASPPQLACFLVGWNALLIIMGVTNFRTQMPSGHFLSDAHTIFYLPTELITLMAGYLCDRDLYTLTHVSHRIACIACPLYFARKSILLSSHDSTLSVRGEGFHALDVWRRSPNFSAMKLLACSFSFDPERATAQMELLQRCLGSLPPYPHTFFGYVHLTHIMSTSLVNLLSLLQRAVILTGCSDLTLSDGAYEEPHSRKKKKKKTRTTTLFSFEFLRCFRLIHFDASSSQWQDFLSSLRIQSLRTFEVWGSSSNVAIFDFLLHHSDIQELRFTRCLWADNPSSSHQLKLPLLQILRGTSYEILIILKSLLSPPVLRQLTILSEPPTRAQSDPFIDQVIDSLTMCDGSISLELQPPNEESMAKLTHTDARALAAHKLCCNTFPLIDDLHIGFHTVELDTFIPVSNLLVNNFEPDLTWYFVLQVCCEFWMALFPHLEQAGLFTVRSDMTFGTVSRHKDGTLKVAWDIAIR